MPGSRTYRTVWVCAVAATCCWASVTADGVAAPAIPPALLSELEERRTDANDELARQRATLATVAVAHRDTLAAATRAEHGHELVDLLLEAFPGRPAPKAYEALTSDLESRQSNLERDIRALDDATEQAARAQGAALDADRRIRALQRAAATEDQRDVGLGSWRFGSGGPAVSAESLDRYLASKASPIAGSGAALLKSGIEHEVDPRLIVAIAGAESYFGLTTCAPHNAWGWGCPNGPFRFDSWAEGIETVTVGLREGYIDDGLTTVGEIHLRYAPPAAANDPTGLNYAWPDNVARFLVEQGGDPQSVAGLLKSSR